MVCCVGPSDQELFQHYQTGARMSEEKNILRISSERGSDSCSCKKRVTQPSIRPRKMSPPVRGFGIRIGTRSIEANKAVQISEPLAPGCHSLGQAFQPLACKPCRSAGFPCGDFDLKPSYVEHGLSQP